MLANRLEKLTVCVFHSNIILPKPFDKEKKNTIINFIK